MPKNIFLPKTIFGKNNFWDKKKLLKNFRQKNNCWKIATKEIFRQIFFAQNIFLANKIFSLRKTKVFPKKKFIKNKFRKKNYKKNSPLKKFGKKNFAKNNLRQKIFFAKNDLRKKNVQKFYLKKLTSFYVNLRLLWYKNKSMGFDIKAT